MKTLQWEPKKLIWDVPGHGWAKTRRWRMIVNPKHLSQKVLSVGKMISTIRPRDQRRNGFWKESMEKKKKKRVNGKREVEFHVSRGCGFGKLLSQRFRHKDGSRTWTWMLCKHPLGLELFKALVFKIENRVASLCWDHIDPSCVERRVVGQGLGSRQCGRMPNGGWFSEQRMILTNVDITVPIIWKVNQLLVNPQGLIRGFIKKKILPVS